MNNEFNEIRECFSQLVGEINTDNNSFVKDEILTAIKKFCDDEYSKSLPQEINKLKACLYIIVKKIKQDFINKTRLLAKQENEFFKFTITIGYTKFDKDDRLNDLAENVGFLSYVYWAERNTKVENGKVKKYLYRRIPFTKSTDDFSYKRAAFNFKNASKWQIDECILCEKKLAPIRKLLNRLTNLKRNYYLCNELTQKLLTDVLLDSEKNKLNLNSNLKKSESNLTPEEIKRREEIEYYEQIKKCKTKDEMWKFMMDYANQHSQDPDVIEFKKKTQGSYEE